MGLKIGSAIFAGLAIFSCYCLLVPIEFVTRFFGC